MNIIVLSVLTAATLMTGVDLANAQTGGAAAGIDPQCANVSNKRGCTCAMETGGTIDPSGRWKYRNSPRWQACMASKGWK